MARLRPSAARAQAAATPNPRVTTQSTSARLALRSKFRHARPIMSRRMPGSGGNSIPTYTKIEADIKFSDTIVTRKISGSKYDAMLERWAYITAGLVPPGDGEAPRVMSADDAEEREAEMIAEVEAAAKNRENIIREYATEEAAEHRKKAQRYEELSHTNPALSVLAESELEEAQSIIREAQIQIANIAEDVREERANIRRQLEREYESQSEELAEYVTSLKAKLNDEVSEVVATIYFDGEISPDQVVEWHFE